MHVVRRILAATTVFGLLTMSTQLDSAVAGPGLALLYDEFKMTESDCIKRSLDILLGQDLRLPNTLLRINQSPIVGGENIDFTAAFDCSLVDETGRIQVIVSHVSETQKAFGLANILLNELRD